MFEQYDACIAVQYTSLGKRIAAYNTKLHTSRRISAKEKRLAVPKKQTVLVYPSHATWKKKQELERKAAEDKLTVDDRIDEAEALVRYHCFQNGRMMQNGLVQVMDIHQYHTDLTVVKIENHRIKPIFGRCVPVGGAFLTEKMLDYYMKKLKRVNGDIFGDLSGMQVLRGMTEQAKLRMANHRMKEDEFLFHSPKDKKTYLLRIFREDYNEMVGELLEIIFEADRKMMIEAVRCGYAQPSILILGGGMNHYEYSVKVIKERAVSQNVLAYKCVDASVLGAALLAAERRR